MSVAKGTAVRGSGSAIPPSFTSHHEASARKNTGLSQSLPGGSPKTNPSNDNWQS